LAPLPPTFPATRKALRALACYVIAPARKARTGRIGLRATGDGFGTPPFEDGSRVLVRGAVLVREPGGAVPISTLRAGAEFLGVALSPNPGVGQDLPPFEPDVELPVDADASFALGSWYSFGEEVLDGVTDELSRGAMSEAQLWPEHFDLAVVVEVPSGTTANVGFAPGDRFCAEPYAYVGPHEVVGLIDAYWNAPFGAYLPHRLLATAVDAVAAARAFVRHGLAQLASLPSP
jgi:hypothetical protein